MDGLKAYTNKRVCVAFSGGVDSTVLLHYLKTYSAEYGYTLSAVHCEHGIRGAESLADKAFVERVCAEWNIPLTVFSENCLERAKREKESLETTARNFRYACFVALLDGDKADLIATAHHQADEAETVLFRLSRGTALAGVSGIREQNGRIIRPLLSWTKAEILAYAKENGLEYCVDATNLETDATRNKIRLQVLPILEDAVPNATANIARFATLAMEDDALLYELSVALLAQTENGYRVAFCDKKPLFTRACLTALKALGVSRDYTALHLADAYALQDKERGARLSLPYGVQAEKGVDGVYFYVEKVEKIVVQGVGMPFREGVFDGGRYEVNVSVSPLKKDGAWEVLRVDADKIPQTAVFRFREDGDRIQKFGGLGKSLKKLFNEKKVPVAERVALPLIVDGDCVLAVCGVEIADTVKVDSHTRNVLYIAIRKR